MPRLHFTWWNLQNFFDTDDDPISHDFAYTPEEGWTQAAFRAKKANLADVLKDTHGGLAPDLVAVCEIEKDDLLAELLQEAGLHQLEVIFDPSGTSDLRGIDVAVAYNPDKLELLEQRTHVVHLRYRTRDIFELVFRLRETGEELVLFATHWPSRRRGKFASEPARIAVAENVAYLVEQHLKVPPREYEILRAFRDLQPVIERWNRRVIVVGDFNDEPFDRSVMDHLNATGDQRLVMGRGNQIRRFGPTYSYRAKEFFLFNAVWHLLGEENLGTYYISGTPQGIKFTNRYQFLDQLLVSRGLLDKGGLHLDVESVGVFRDPKRNATPSMRPRPFDKKKGKGYSDHFPLVATFVYGEP